MLAAFLVAAGFSGISNGIALLTRQEATMIAVANFIGLPLLFFSSILIAASLIPDWMETLSLANPVEWAVRASRGQALPNTNWGDIGLYLGLLACFTALTGAFATRCFRSYQRNALTGEPRPEPGRLVQRDPTPGMREGRPLATRAARSAERGSRSRPREAAATARRGRHVRCRRPRAAPRAAPWRRTAYRPCQERSR